MKIKGTRREFLSHSAVLAGAMSLSPAIAAVSTANTLSLSGAGYRFPRTQALFDKAVPIQNCELGFEEAGIGDINSDILSGPQRWDVTEIGLHPFMLAYANENFRDYSLLPIYPLRVFRHKSIFIRTDRGITKPADLKGKTIATPGYSSTSLTWIRGILSDEYGVTPEDINWVYSRKDSSADLAGKVSAQENVFPEGISIRPGPAGVDESELLASGAVDGLFHAVEPKAFNDGHPRIARLFADSRATEQAYYEKTAIFPIMHVVAVRRSLLDDNPWLATALFGAYSQAKSLAYQKMSRMGWAADMLPWYGQELADSQEIMGKNFYSYGLKSNEKSLNALFRYSYEQGLASRQLTVRELFHPTGLKLEEG